MRGQSRWLPGTLLAAVLGLVAGCNDTNTGQDQRNGRGNGDQLPTSGPGSEGTNGAATTVNAEGPGSPAIIKNDSGFKPGESTKYGGDGAGAAPPVTPSSTGPGTGDSNGGQLTGDQKTIGADATGNTAAPNANNGGPGTGSPPK